MRPGEDDDGRGENRRERAPVLRDTTLDDDEERAARKGHQVARMQRVHKRRFRRLARGRFALDEMRRRDALCVPLISPRARQRWRLLAGSEWVGGHVQEKRPRFMRILIKKKENYYYYFQSKRGGLEDYTTGGGGSYYPNDEFGFRTNWFAPNKITSLETSGQRVLYVHPLPPS